MRKLLYRLWKAVTSHTHCYSDKKIDCRLSNGDRFIIMKCSQCGKEQAKIIKEVESKNGMKLIIKVLGDDKNGN